MFANRSRNGLRGGLILLIVLLASLAFGQERRVMRRPPPTATVPPQQTPQGSRGGFEWERFLGGMLQGQMQGGRRPGPGRVPERPPNYVRPVYPEYVPPREIPTIPENFVVPPPVNVAPGPNQVVTAIPPQPSPLEGRVWEVSGREAYCYSLSLARLVNQAFSDGVNSLGKGAPNVMQIEAQVEQIRQLLANNGSWRDIEPIARRLMEEHRSAFSEKTLEQVQQAIQMLMVRDAFRLVVESGPRGRGTPFSIEAVPVGVIWIVYDPTLAVGTGLFLNDQVLVCGGGEGELYVTRGTVAAGLGLPVGAGPPVPDIDPEKAHELRDSITIHHKRSAATPVNYVLNRRQPFTIQPGHTQKLPTDQKWTIEFDRGAGGGTARYALSKGCYEFRVVDNRWGIFKLKFEVTIDNREGQQDFVYLMNNEIVNVPAGKTQAHVGNDPIVIEFDRGAGPDAPARKNLNKSGTYKVAVDTENNYLDLFGDEQSG